MDAQASSNEPIKTFLFFDCETTGLPRLENNKTRITEMCIEAVQEDHLLQNENTLPRVINKLHLCFNPDRLISSVAAKITGLNNELLKEQPIFTIKTVETISNFIDLQRKPVCLVAHNGNKFDYPLLQRHIKDCTDKEIMNEILCVDSLEIFKEIHNATKEEEDRTGSFASSRFTSFKLVDVYRHLFGEDAPNSHRAEGDVELMMLCSSKLGQSFVDVANKRVIKFNSIPAL